jgi:hypothetical protein
MRASVISAIVVGTLLCGGAARAQPLLLAPRSALTLAIDWNSLATAKSHSNPAVTGVAPAMAERDAAAVGHAEEIVRNVVIPHYVMPDGGRQPIHQVYVTPFTPYLGAYGLNITFETKALLH